MGSAGNHDTADNTRKKSGANTWWWLRSPYSGGSSITGVALSDGKLNGHFVNSDDGGVNVSPVENKDGSVTFRFDPRKCKDAARIAEMVTAWADVSAKYRNGDMSRDDYDTWRYSYPSHDETQNYVKVPSQELSDALVEAFKEKS